MMPNDPFVRESARSFAKLVADADICAGVYHGPGGIAETAASIVSIMGGDAVFSSEVVADLREAAIQGYNERLQFLKSVSDRIGGG
ncbi:hypothetical protein ACYG9R_09215 [Mesorhizobium sp. RSR565B]|uniref:hypothetical protein n=1 Tax=Mesorhizobium sp. L103C565B0 TaxID=1287094 RepID=UPI0003D04A6A|nr:hypothetical protein [Mesorhizobium sp. L103C565B0]ESZ50975.1 hypothetical protein X730_12070 [Mesorhizobium sp. L103C565B0]